MLLRVIGSTKSPPASAGLELLLAASSRDMALNGGVATAAVGTAYLRRELDFAWDCMQKEAQALLTELLQPGNLQSTPKDFQPGQLLTDLYKDIFADCTAQSSSSRRTLTAAGECPESAVAEWLASQAAYTWHELVRCIAGMLGSKGSKLSFSFDVQVNQPSRELV